MGAVSMDKIQPYKLNYEKMPQYQYLYDTSVQNRTAF